MTPRPDHVAAADLLRTLRHELRTPINHIVGYAELLLDEAEDHGLEAVIDDLRKIHQAGTQLLSLVNDALAADRLATAGPDLDQLSGALRTPLNAIIGYSGLLREEAEDGEYGALVPDLHRIETAGKNLLALVLSSADLSRRVEGGTIEPHVPSAALTAAPTSAAPVSERGRERGLPLPVTSHAHRSGPALTVNTVARIESSGTPGSVTLSAAAWATLADRARSTSLGIVEIKGKGPLELFRFEGFEADTGPRSCSP